MTVMELKAGAGRRAAAFICVTLVFLLSCSSRLLAVEGFSFLKQYEIKAERPSLIISMGDKGYALYDSAGGGQISVLNSDLSLKKSVLLAEIPDCSVSRISGMVYNYLTQQIVAFDAKRKLVLVLSSEGKLDDVISLSCSGPEPLKKPSCMAIDYNGLIYIGDPARDDIKVFSMQGTYLLSIHIPFGADGKKPGFSPCALAVLSDGTVMAVDDRIKNIFVFSREGQFAYEKRLEGEYNSIMRIIPLQSGEFVGLDDHDRIYKWDSGGHIKSGFGSRGENRGQFKELSDITCNSDGNIVALDSEDRDIQMFSFETPCLPLDSEPRNLEYSVVQSSIKKYDARIVGLMPDGVILFDSSNKQVLVERRGDQVQVLKHPEMKKITTALAAYGRIYLFDRSFWKSKVLVFNEESGMFEFAFGSSGEGRLRKVVRILPGEGNTLFFADKGDTKIKVFSSDGIFSTSFGKKGDDEPSGIGSLEDIVWHKKNLAILDSKRNQIHLFDSRAGFVKNVDIQSPAYKVDFTAIGVDANNYFLLLDSRSSRMFVVDENGATSFLFGSRGKRPQDWRDPGFLEIDANGLLRVAEADKVSRVITYRFASAGPLSQAEFAIQNRDWDRARKILEPYLSENASGLPGYMRAMRLSMRAYAVSEADDPFLTEAQLIRVRQALEEYIKSSPESVLEHMALAYSLKHDGRIEEAMAVIHSGKRHASDPRYDKMLSTWGAELEATGKTSTVMAITECRVPVILSALSQNYYDTPVIEVTVVNNGGRTSPPGKATFFSKAIMDNPTETPIPQVDPFGSVDVKLRAAFNRNILTYEEDSIMSGEIMISFGDASGTGQVLQKNVTFQLLSRNSIDWKQEEMITCFITLKDPDVQLFARQAIKIAEDRMSTSDLDSHLYKALTLFDAMQSIGLYYAPDPRQPFNFADVAKSGQIDYLQYPRETLIRQSGDCDDLSVLYAALLEASGIPTILVTSPGHIFAAFQLEKGRQSVDALGLSEDLLIERDGRFYVPVEVTLLGSPFISAWRVAANTVSKYNKDGSIGFIVLQDAWTRYKTVSLPPVDRVAPVPDAPTLNTLLSRELDALNLRQIEKRLAVFKSWLKRDKNNTDLLLFLARSYSMVGMFDEALHYAEKASGLTRNNSDVLQVLGNVAYMQNDYKKALDYYQKAYKISAKAAIQVNIALTCLKSGALPAARSAYKEAKRLDPGLIKDYPELTQLLE